MFQRLPAGLYKVDDVLLRARLTVDQDGFSDAACGKGSPIIAKSGK
jgi:hypothetical protein